MPDGTQVKVQLHGDEFFNYMTDEQGFLMTPRQGGIVEYKLDSNGARLQATPLLLNSMRAETVEALDPEMRRAAANGGVARIAAHDKQGRTTFPTLGDGHYLVVLMEYSDVKWSIPDPATTMNEMLNGDSYDYMGTPGSLRQYYIDNSNGKFSPTFDIVGPVTLPETSAYYTDNSKYGKIKEAVTTAARMVDDQVDFSKYDIDGDGNIDNIIFWYAGYGQADTADPTCIWPHNSSAFGSELVLDGKTFGPYCCFNELNGGVHYQNKDGVLAGLGLPIHEFGHVMGFPDLYDPAYQVMTTPGVWSIFDSGCYCGDSYVPVYLSAYERWVFRWIEFDNIEETGHYEIGSLHNFGQPLRLQVNGSSGTVYLNEYFVFETRDCQKWDSKLPLGGMLIWHIDYDRSIFTSNRVNSSASRNRCHLISADGSGNYTLGNLSQSNFAAWPQDVNYITPETRINLYANYLLARGPVPHYFTNIAYDVERGVSSFDFDMITESPNITTLLLEPTRQSDSGAKSRLVTFNWEPVEGATGYQFTMYRINSSGQKVYEGGYEEKDLGNVTSLEYTFPSNKLSTKFYIYVRPVQGIPSTQTSNVVEFVPSELEVAGVEEVGAAQEVVRGLKGAIDAPVSARVYTIAGAPAPRTDLAPGIYLVVCDGKTYKVIVK